MKKISVFLCAILLVIITVGIVDALPIAEIDVFPDPTFVGEITIFDGSGSYDTEEPDKTLVLWEWDLDYDGVYDMTGLIAQWVYGSEGIFPVGLRVTNDIGEYDWTSVEVTVNAAPVPEPTTMLLLGTGLAGLVGLGRKKFFKRQ